MLDLKLPVSNDILYLILSTQPFSNSLEDWVASATPIDCLAIENSVVVCSLSFSLSLSLVDLLDFASNLSLR